MNKDTSGQAFPIQDLGAHGQYGMTLRQWYAGMAMQAVIVQCSADTLIHSESPEEMFARKSFEIADAMLAQEDK